jgi:hypothetical protein
MTRMAGGGGQKRPRTGMSCSSTALASRLSSLTIGPFANLNAGWAPSPGAACAKAGFNCSIPISSAGRWRRLR